MLKGKNVRTDGYFGLVLNDAEREAVLILRVIREQITRYNSQDTISRLVGVPAIESWWKVTEPTVVAIPWCRTGDVVICESLPKDLYARYLR
jgi:hypothetical protein